MPSAIFEGAQLANGHVHGDLAKTAREQFTYFRDRSVQCRQQNSCLAAMVTDVCDAGPT